jgi:hypothetical protein
MFSLLRHSQHFPFCLHTYAVGRRCQIILALLTQS